VPFVLLKSAKMERRFCAIHFIIRRSVRETRTAVNLSACLAKAGRRVLVVDLDSQANCTSHFGIDPEAQRRNAYHALTEAESELRSVVLNVRPNLDLVPAMPNGSQK
jgi:chromosome partitioning protein